MADLIQLNVTGLDGVLETLKQLPAEVVSKRGGPVKLALAKGARMLRDAVRDAAPVRTGLLRSAIVAKRGKMRGQGERYIVTVKKETKIYAKTRANTRSGRAGKEYQTEGPLFYARFTEYGTKHEPARPWLRPTAEANGQRIVDTVNADLVRRVELLVAKIARANGVPK